jgi:hypothetical protein
MASVRSRAFGWSNASPRSDHLARPIAWSAVGTIVEHRTTSAGASRLSAARIRPLRILPTRFDGSWSTELELRFEMALCERTARAGFQVLDDDMTLPRSARRSVRTTARIVVRQSGAHIRREADVEMRILIGVSQNVNETFVVSHAPVEASGMPGWEPPKLAQNETAMSRKVAVSASARCAPVADSALWLRRLRGSAASARQPSLSETPEFSRA